MISQDYKAIRSALRNERERRKLTQIKLAEKLGIHPVTLSYWETLGPPRFDMFMKWANELGCSIVVVPKNKTASDYTTLLNQFHELSNLAYSVESQLKHYRERK